MDDIATRGENLRRYFKAQGLTQKEAADRIGISTPHLSNMLNGHENFGVKKVKNIVAAFPEVSEAYLLTGQGQLVPGGAVRRPERDVLGVGENSLVAEIEDLRAQLERERGEKARLLGIIESMSGK